MNKEAFEGNCVNLKGVLGKDFDGGDLVLY